MTASTSHSKEIPTLRIFKYRFFTFHASYTTPHNRKDKRRYKVKDPVVKNGQYHQRTYGDCQKKIFIIGWYTHNRPLIVSTTILARESFTSFLNVQLLG